MAVAVMVGCMHTPFCDCLFVYIYIAGLITLQVGETSAEWESRKGPYVLTPARSPARSPESRLFAPDSTTVRCVLGNVVRQPAWIYIYTHTHTFIRRRRRRRRRLFPTEGRMPADDR